MSPVISQVEAPTLQRSHRLDSEVSEAQLPRLPVSTPPTCGEPEIEGPGLGAAGGDGGTRPVWVVPGVS
ncbi:MAG: hypothetical protein WKF40_00510 [Thermoleophilaceae bacterium]